MKKIISLLITIIVAIPTVAFSAHAASSAIISFSKSTISVGENLTVTVTVNPGKKFSALQYVLNYDENVLKFKSTDSSSEGGAGVIKLVESFPSKTKSTYKFVFNAISTGSATISVSDCFYADEAGEYDFGGASAKMTVKDKTLSNNAKLKSLSISGVKLSPSFSSSKTKYTATVSNNTEKVNVIAKTDDSDAKVKSVTGNTNLKVGKNSIIVTVEAANGSQRNYTITVTRLDKTPEKEEIEEKEEEKEPEKVEEEELNITIAGTEYIVVSKIPSDALFKNFKISEIDFQDKKIEVAVDEAENYQLFYLKSVESDELVPYVYNESVEEFEKLKFLNFNDNVYIFEEIPDDFVVPQNLFSSNLQIGDLSVESLVDSDQKLSDFSYVYCYLNGNHSFYRYDNLEGTLQRYPDIESVKISTNIQQKKSFIDKFNSLSVNGKVIIIALLIAVLGVISLLVMLITYFVKKSKTPNPYIDLCYYDDQEDFDKIVVENQDYFN